MKDTVKQDINFLEYPIWRQGERGSLDFMKCQDKDGYIYEATAGVPSKVDMIFLYYILLECQCHNWAQKLTLSKYQILNGCDISPTKERRDRLEKGLEKWEGVRLFFCGTFYTGTEYTKLKFRIIDTLGFRKDNKVEIRLNAEWIEKIKQSEFFKYISFSQMKALRSPLALRLYEILVKTFYKRLRWEIDVLKLAAKIPMNEKYVSDITKKIIPATKRIREKTEFNVIVEVVKQGRGKGKFIFRKMVKHQPQQTELFTPDKETPLPAEILSLVPEAWRVDAMQAAERVYKHQGPEELKAAILHINGRIKGGLEFKNGYGAFLTSCIQNEWHKEPARHEEIKIDAENKAVKDRNNAEQARICKELRKGQEEINKAKSQHNSMQRLRQMEKMDPEQYQALRKRAADTQGIDLDKMKRGDEGKVKLEMAELI